MEENCLFCDIFYGKIPSRVIYKDENTIAVLDAIPRLAEGQCVVIHKNHVKQFYELNDSEIAEFFITVKKVAQKLYKVYKPEYVCLFSRGQTVPHVHVIIYPSSPYGTMDGILKSIDVTRQLTLKMSNEKTMDEIASTIKDA